MVKVSQHEYIYQDIILLLRRIEIVLNVPSY